MKIVVLLRMVPDVVEELEIAADNRSLDLEFLRMILSESDDHALEEALILKERHGAQVTVVAPEAPDIDEALFTALAKGADRAVKICDIEPGAGTRATARACTQALSNVPGLLPADLILSGAQAIDDLDGLIAPLIAHELDLPYLGIVTGVKLDGTSATVIKEYPGGLHGEFEISLPAVLGIQSAEKPPRYVPVAKVRAAMKSQAIEASHVPTMADGGLSLVQVVEMNKPEATGQAEMLDGPPERVAGRLCGILTERGLL